MGGRAGLVPHVHKQAIIRDYARRHRLSVLVETGTYRGDMVAAMRNTFREIHSIELDADLHRSATDRFAGSPHVFVYQGDSGKVMPAVLKGLQEPALFWLDGHFSGGVTAKAGTDTPVRAEVAEIFRAGGHAHVVLIDDARLFTGEGDYPSLAELESLVRGFRPQASVTAEDDVIRVVANPAAAAAARPGSARGGGPGMKEALTGEALADQLRSDDPPVALDQRAVGLVAEGELADAPHDGRIDAAGDDQQGQRHADRNDDVRFHRDSPCINPGGLATDE